MLTRELAAAYAGVSLRMWDMEVAEKIWPAPLPRGKVASQNPRLTWDRHQIDRAIDNMMNSGCTRSETKEAEHLDDWENRRKRAKDRRNQQN